MPLATFTSRLTQLGLVAAALVGANAASAVPIQNWEYSVSSAFVVGATNFDGAGPGTSNGCETVGTTSIVWGSCSAFGDRSSVGITNSPSSGTAMTNGAAVLANTYTHVNNPLAGAFATLDSTKIAATLNLRVAGSGSAWTTKTAIYDIFFSETPNTAGTCVVTSPSPCNDIWVMRGSLNNSIVIGADEYFFSFYASPTLATLSPAACAATGSPSPCIGFTTAEGLDNRVSFLMAITSERITVPGQVPEPASIALLGAGLLGLAGVRSRRQKSNKA